MNARHYLMLAGLIAIQTPPREAGSTQDPQSRRCRAPKTRAELRREYYLRNRKREIARATAFRKNKQAARGVPP